MGVLVVDDEEGIGPLLRSHLHRQGVDAAIACTVDAVDELVGRRPFVVAVVDLAVDGGRGLEVVAGLRAADPRIHVIAMSGSAAEADRSLALAGGADDYVVKPVFVREVANRVLAVRRRESTDQDRLLRVGSLTIDLRSRRVHAEDRLVELTEKEFDLLAYLAARPGHVFTADQLLRAVWWAALEGQPAGTVADHVERLRAALERDRNHPELLRTVAGGYCFDEAETGPDGGEDDAATAGVVVQVAGRIVAANQELVALVGVADEGELVGRELVDLVTRSSRAAVEARNDAVAAGRTPLTQLIDIARGDGTEVAVELDASTIEWEGAPARRIVLTPIREPSARLRLLMTGVLSEMADAVIITDLHFHVRSWNRAAARLYGWTEAEVIGRHMLDIVRWGGDHAALDEAWKALELQGRWRGEARQATRDGSVLGVLASTTLVRDDAGEAIGFVSVNRPARPRIDPSAADELGGDDVRRGLEAGELTVHYQPVVSLDPRWSIVSVEALVRWEHPERGLLSPGAFIDAAEREGSIIDIGALVLDTACRQAAAWRARGFDFTVSVNLSARELGDPSLFDRVASVLRRTHLPPTQLWLEVTETSLVEDVDTAGAALRQLTDLGVNIAIDDFGTGWACLTYLRTFPIQALKIDRSFVNDLTRNPSDQAIVRSILSLGHELGLFVIAEGIETVAQQRALQELGCTLGQGYLYGRPTPASGVELHRARRTASTSRLDSA